MKNYNSGNLLIEVIEKDDVYEISWLGKSDDREPANTLIPYFTSLVDTFSTEKPVRIDFSSLQYMNSSTVRPILLMLQQLEQKNRDTTVIYDPNVTFQRTSFQAIDAVTRAYSCITVITVNDA